MSIIFTIIYWALQLFMFALVARALLSWLPNVDYSNPLIRMLYDFTEPVLSPIRRMLPPNMGMDLSPLIVIIIIQVFLRVIF